jgi:NNP family nitrate/nitrite transporter-like MFS transporter
MASFKTVMKSGHPPTLFAAFLYFDFCFAIWVLNGAMGPFITETYKLTPAQTGFMISLPILAGALMRFPLGILAQYIGRKNAAITEMSVIMLAMAYGYLFVSSYNDVLAMGVLLGIAGASFGVALSLGSGWFPPEHKGLAMGIAGAGNSGTVLAVLFAPPLAQAYGWQTTYAFAGVVMLLPLVVMIVLAKEPPDREHQSFKEHISCLFTKDGWAFSLIYVITFGGFVGLSNFLPTFFYEQHHRQDRGPVGGAARGHCHVPVADRDTVARADHAPVHAVLRGARSRQRRALPARAPALAEQHGGGRLDDR